MLTFTLLITVNPLEGEPPLGLDVGRVLKRLTDVIIRMYRVEQQEHGTFCFRLLLIPCLTVA